MGWVWVRQALPWEQAQCRDISYQDHCWKKCRGDFGAKVTQSVCKTCTMRQICKAKLMRTQAREIVESEKGERG